MNNTLKDILKSTVISIGMSLTIFSFVCIVFDIGYGGNFSLEGYRMTKMIIGCVIIGLGFGVPTIIYKNDSLPMPVRVLIHMGIGCVIYTIVAYAVGWIGGSASLGQGIAIAAIQLVVAFIIWFCFMRYYRSEAKMMNDKIQQMK
jgi:phosphate starvation-inducible membrane PsiE